MNKLKKIADIIVIGLAIAVVVILGDKIIKIGNDARDGIYFGQEQESSSEIDNEEEAVLQDADVSADINLKMEIDQSLFKQGKDFLAAALAEEKEKIVEVSEETVDSSNETSDGTMDKEEDESSAGNSEVQDSEDPAQEEPGESSSDPGSDTSIIENIDYSNSTDFRIEIDLSRQRLTVFYMDEVLKEMVCSGGAPGYPTPLGEFTTIQKIEYSWIPRFEMGAYYWIRFFEDYLIHSVPFDEKGEMIVEEFEKLGNPASHGCIRLRLEEAKWLYETFPLGIKVLIY